MQSMKLKTFLRCVAVFIGVSLPVSFYGGRYIGYREGSGRAVEITNEAWRKKLEKSTAELIEENEKKWSHVVIQEWQIMPRVDIDWDAIERRWIISEINRIAFIDGAPIEHGPWPRIKDDPDNRPGNQWSWKFGDPIRVPVSIPPKADMRLVK